MHGYRKLIGSINSNDVTGEPCALKGARTVRGGTVGNVLSDETTRRGFGMSKEIKQQRAGRLLYENGSA